MTSSTSQHCIYYITTLVKNAIDMPSKKKNLRKNSRIVIHMSCQEGVRFEIYINS